MATVAESIVEMLSMEGVRHVFGVPSEGFTPFLDALHGSPDITFVAARQEGGAAFMAEAYANVSRSLGVALAGRAVGATNLSIGVHTARENSTPVLFLVSHVGTGTMGREGFQEIDLAAFFRPLAKAVVDLRSGRGARGRIARAVTEARSGRPGPVVIVVPEDVFAEEATGTLAVTRVEPGPAPSPEVVGNVIERLAGSARPVIVAGMGVIRSGAQRELTQFSETRGIPVVAAWRRHDVISNNSPAYAGHLQMGTHPDIKQTVEDADLIIALGCRLNEITSQDYTLIDPRTCLVQVDISDEMIGKSHPVTVGVHADAKQFLLAALGEYGGSEAWQDRQPWMRQRHEVFLRLATRVPEPSNDGIGNADAIRTLRAALAPDALLTNDAGNFAGWVHTYFDFPEAHTYVGAASGAMGYAVPAAIGAQLAAPRRQVVAVAGDGGFLMTVQELATAAGLGLPIICVVFNNSSYGSIRMHQEKQFPGRVIGSDLHNPDLVQLARSFGLPAARPSTLTEFERELTNALRSRRPAVIEVVTDIEQISVWSTITELRKKAAGA